MCNVCRQRCSLPRCLWGILQTSIPGCREHDGHDVVMVGGTFDATNVDLHVGKSSDQTHTVFLVANLWLTPSINPP